MNFLFNDAYVVKDAQYEETVWYVLEFKNPNIMPRVFAEFEKAKAYDSEFEKEAIHELFIRRETRPLWRNNLNEEN